MTPFERIYNRLSGKPVDRAPNLNILMAFAAKYIGVSYDKFCSDYKYLVEANLKCNEYFGIDMLSTMSDPLRETYDFGASVEFPFDTLPVCKVHFISESSDIKKLRLFDPLNSTRMLDRLRAIEEYKRQAGNHYSILGWVEGSFAEAADLRGVSEIMIDLYDDPDFVKEILEICCQEAIICAREQIDSGADFIGIGDAAASLTSPSIYREFILPYEQRIIEEIHRNGARAKLHICGNITHLLDDILKTGADIVDIDYPVDFKAAVEKFKGIASINGNYDPVRVVNNGTPELVKQAVKNCLIAGDATTFISAGCEIPRNTPYENLKAADEALIEAAHEYK